MVEKHRDIWEAVGGKAPLEWDFLPIAEILETPKSISVGVMYPGQSTPDGVPLIRVSDVKSGSVPVKPDFCISHEVDHEYRRTKLNGSELLVTLVGSPGDCVIVDQEMIGWNVARALAVIRLKDPSLRTWIRYTMLSKPAKHLIDARLNTTVQKTLNLKDIKELGIPVPPKGERDFLTQPIENIERKQNLLVKINQTLEAMAQACFKSWFVDFEPTRAKMAALAAGGTAEDATLTAMSAISGKSAEELATLKTTNPEAYADLHTTASLFPSRLVDSELGEIPEGWEVSEIGKEVAVVGGGTPSTKKPEFWDDGDIPWTTPKDLSNLNDKILIDTDRKITKQGLAKISSGLLPVNTVLMSSRAPVGYLALAKVPVAVNQGYIAMKCEKNLTPEYVLQWCAANMDDIKLRASGTTFAEISKSTFRPMTVLVPEAEVLQAYSRQVAAIYSQIETLVRENHALACMRDSLLPKLLSGEIIIEENHGGE